MKRIGLAALLVPPTKDRDWPPKRDVDGGSPAVMPPMSRRGCCDLASRRSRSADRQAATDSLLVDTS